MGTIGKITLSLEAQSAAFSKGTETAGQDLRHLGDAAKHAEHDLGGVKGALESLKASAGRGSELDELFKTLKGSGAVMGISLVGEELNKVSEKAGELSKQFQEGKINAADVTNELAKAVPVLGGFVSAFENVREMFTHEKEEIDDINAEIKTGNTLMEDRVRIQKENKKANEELAEELRKANELLALSQATNPDDRKKIEEANRVADAKQADVQRYREKEALSKESTDKQIENIRKEGEEQKKLAELRADQQISRYDGDSDADNENMRADAKRKADLEVEAETNQKIKNAQTAADAELAIEKKTLDDIAAAREGAIKNNARNELEAKAAAANLKIEKGALEDVNSFLGEIAKAGDEINKTSERAREKAYEQQQRNIAEVKRTLDDLKREAAQAGMSEADKKLDDLKRMPGSTPDDIRAAQALSAQIDKMQEWKKQQEEANKLIESSMTPIEKYQQQIDRVQKLFQEGLISAQVQSEAIQKATAELHKATEDPNENKHAAATTRRFDFFLPKDNKPDAAAQQLAAQLKQLAEQQKANDYAADMWRFANDAAQALEDVINF